jgi:putative two-component system response regulator
MPEMDGYELVELIRSNQKSATLPVIFVSAIYSDEYHHRKGYSAGAVDFMSKPFAPEILLSKVQVFIKLYQQRLQLETWNQYLVCVVAERTEELARSYDETLLGWARTLELRERETAGHSRRVVELTLRLAEQIGIPADERVQIYRGALLHDIGKMGVPDSILLKPSGLTPEEWEIMRKHPVYAYELLGHIQYLGNAIDIPYCHHEHWDGGGYPRGIRGIEIPLSARIFALADVWDAMTSDRPYRPALPKKEVEAYLRERKGKQFDPALVDGFLQIVNQLEPAEAAP